MRTRIMKLAIIMIAVPLFVTLLLTSTSARASATGDEFDAASFYKAKCAMCHGAKAEKKFDAAKTDEQHIEAIMKGKEGTPKMPGYEDKGVSVDQAKALVVYMKTLKQ